MKNLYLLTDLGRVRVLETRVDSALAGGRRHLADCPDDALDRSTPPLGEVVTDQAGRFAQGGMAGQAGGMSYGEEHELERELSRQAIAAIAGHLDAVVARRERPRCVLAAPKSILKTLEAALSGATREAIVESIPADLTKTPLPELEERFLA